MKNFLRTLLLVTIGCMILSPIAMAQDARSVVLPSPWSNRVGTQLVYFFEEGVSSSARGAFKSYLTITNTSITSSVTVHYQFYTVILSGSSATQCQELFDWSSTLTQGQRWIIDPARVTKGPLSSVKVGEATNGKFILTATPVVNPTANDYRVSAFNWLSGTIWESDFKSYNTYMTNAISRMAVDKYGNMATDGTIVAGPALASPVLGQLDGNDFELQTIAPYRILVNSFFATAGPAAVQQGVPFGNRMTFFAWRDVYPKLMEEPFYRISGGSVSISGHVFDDAETPYSIPVKGIQCLTEYTIAPDVETGNFTNFIGSALNSSVAATGGWIRLTVGYASATNFVGWFSQNLLGFGGGDYMIGMGRAAWDWGSTYHANSRYLSVFTSDVSGNQVGSSLATTRP